MKRLVILALIMVSGAAVVSAQTMMSVEVRETQVRVNPSFLGRVEGNLAYGDRVEVLEQRQGWARVRLDGLTGWVNMSALTTKRVVLQAGGTAQRGATGSEVALAGRGFNQDVENRYREEQQLDFAVIDEIEAHAVDPERIAEFLLDGGLRLPGGDE